MQAMVTLFVLVGGAIAAALVASIGMAGAIQLTSKRTHGYMHLIFYAILIGVALDSVLLGRNLTSTASTVGETIREIPKHPLLVWLQPVISLFILTVTGERIITYWITPRQGTRVPPLLLTVFLIYWVGTVAAPAFFGAHPFVSHDYVYPVIIGVAVLLASGVERDLAFRAARNALFVFVLGGLLIIPFEPSLVLDAAYNQGLLPGVPRLAGLAAHAVSLGALTQLTLLCLLACPYDRRWLNRLAWVVGLAVLFLAQSKTAWISFALCSACIFIVKGGPGLMRRVGDPVRNELGIVLLLGFMALVVMGVGLAMFGGLGARLDSFFDSAEGAQLTSMTGRDLIWAIAQDEWRRSPVFGYGPTLWNADFRAAIGMANATSAHNQFMDTLSRSGSVGAAALVLYAVVLLVLSVRYARVSGGLSIALFLALALRSVSEVPLLLFGYGPELLAHMLLLMTLAAAASARRNSPSRLKQAPGWSRPASTEQFGTARAAS